MDWTLRGENLDWHGNYPVSLDGLVATVETRNPKTGSTVVRLLDAQKPGEEAETRGELDLATRHWHVWLDCGSVAIPKQGFGLAMMLGAGARPTTCGSISSTSAARSSSSSPTGGTCSTAPAPWSSTSTSRTCRPEPGGRTRRRSSGSCARRGAPQRHRRRPRDLELVGRLRANDLTAFER